MAVHNCNIYWEGNIQRRHKDLKPCPGCRIALLREIRKVVAKDRNKMIKEAIPNDGRKSDMSFGSLCVVDRILEWIEEETKKYE